MSNKSPFMIDITNTNISSLSNNPSRVDRLIVEYYYEYNRVNKFIFFFLFYFNNNFFLLNR
jgi:hypothetical protein